MAIIDVKARERICIITQTVSVEFLELNAKGMIKTNATYFATTTDQYQVYNGVKRRLFIDDGIDFGIGREMWLEERPTVIKQESVEDGWPDTIA